MKKTAIICILSMLLTMITPFAALAAVNTADGTLYWDFESPNQVAPPPISSSNAEIYWQGGLNDEIEAGAWTCLDPIAGGNQNSFPTVHVAVANEVYKKSTDNGWDAPEGFYPVRLYAGKLAEANKAATFTADVLEGKGNYCIGALSKNNKAMRVLGMCIKLSDVELIPGQSYKLECDVYQSSPGTSKPSQKLYAGFGVPSARENASVARGVSGTTYEPYSFDAYPKEYNAKSPENATLVGSVPDETWTNLTFTGLTADAADYENGETVFYIGIANFGETVPDTGVNQYVAGGTKIFFDNIKLTPIDENGEALRELTHSAVTVGEIWDFEDSTGALYKTEFAEGENQENFSAPDNTWAVVRENDLQRTCTYANVTDVEALLKTNSFNNQIGNAAEGSSKAIGINKRDGDGVGGIKVYLSKDKYPAGEYTLKFTVAHPSKTSSEVLYAALYSGKWSPASQNNAAPNSNTVATYTASANESVKLPNPGPWWSTVSCNITLDESDFDENGYATLALLTSRIWKFNATATGNYYNGDVCTYYDDISFTRNNEDDFISNFGENNQVIVKTAVYGETAKDILAIGALYDTFSDDPTIMLSGGVESADNVLGIKTLKFPITNNTDPFMGLPQLKVFVFENETLDPLLKNPYRVGGVQ